MSDTGAPVTTDAAKAGSDTRPSRRDRRSGKKAAAAKPGGAAQSAVTVPKLCKDEVFLVVSLAVSGRSPLNGWIVSLGAVLIAAERRSVVGLLEQQLLPLTTQYRVEPAADVVGYLRRQRPALEYMSRKPISAMEAMAELGRFCAPYANVALVGAPLMSIYGWLSYYWSAYQQHVMDQHPAPALPPALPWGFSGLCARSYAAGCLGVPMKAVLKDARYQRASDGFEAIGLPLTDALAAAAGFSHLYWQQQHRQPSQGTEAAATSAPAVPPLTFEVPVPAHVVELGCVPLSVCATRLAPALAVTPTTAAPRCQRTLLELLVDKSIRDGLQHHAPPPPSSPPTSPLLAMGAPSSASPAPFTAYPSITSLEFNAAFEARLPPCLRTEEPWVATEKVHGSNFAIFCDGSEIWAGRRTAWLGLRDSPAFFDFVYLLEAARPAIMACYAQVTAWVRARSPGPATAGAPLVVSIACELAGGEYPHPHVPVDVRGTRVQSGVFYCNRNFLYGFDIGVESVETAAPSLAAALQSNLRALLSTAAPPCAVACMPWNPVDGRYYLPFDDAEAIFKASGFPTYATARHTGTLDALQALPDIGVFPSCLAQDWFGLPALPDNMAEGVVLRPRRDWWVRGAVDGSAASAKADSGWSRVMIKVKHPRFSEFSHKDPPCSAASASTTTATTGTTGGLATITDFLTEARVSAVLSKHTQDEQRDTAEMARAVLADAIKDAEALQRSIVQGTQRKE